VLSKYLSPTCELDRHEALGAVKAFFAIFLEVKVSAPAPVGSHLRGLRTGRVSRIIGARHAPQNTPRPGKSLSG
jgi:hypothetical protein